MPGPLAVNVITAIEKEVTEWSEFTGRMEAVDSVEIHPRACPANITEIHFKAGDLVREGDSLFSIDPRPYRRERNVSARGRGNQRDEQED